MAQRRSAAETGTFTRDQILSGSWKTANLRRYDVTKLPKKVYPGKVHPYQRIIAEMREILLEMGFEELYGDIVQQCFWNFDALFQPQDHPAREKQDTFYLKETIPLPPGYEKVKAMHISGGDTSSTGWGGVWREEKAEQCVLRTHTTSLSIQHLALNRTPPVKAFAVGRVYRRETIDTTHLAEFEHLEGIVMDEGVTFGNLLGILREFYNRMGFESVRFKPSYYPYTEPSLDAEVYIDGIGWIEMGGAGVFREVARDGDRLRPMIEQAHALGVRVSLFIDPEPEAMRLAREVGADRVELYREPYAFAFGTDAQAATLARYRAAAQAAQAAGLGVNAGHDLNRDSLPPVLTKVPGVLEVAIGHALTADALEFGMAAAVRMYVATIRSAEVAGREKA